MPKLDQLSNVSQANMLTNRDATYQVEAQAATPILDDVVEQVEESEEEQK